MSLGDQIHELALRARLASHRIAELSTREKDAWLLRAADRLEAAQGRIREANALDLDAARERGIAAPLVKRLELAEPKWRDMLAGLRDVAGLPDPVGRIESMTTRSRLLFGSAASRSRSSARSSASPTGGVDFALSSSSRKICAT